MHNHSALFRSLKSFRNEVCIAIFTNDTLRSTEIAWSNSTITFVTYPGKSRSYYVVEDISMLRCSEDSFDWKNEKKLIIREKK